MRGEGRLDIAIGRRAGAFHAQLLEEKGERLLEIGADRGADLGRQIPEPALERPDRFLAALVDELLFGVALLPLVFGFRFHPGVHLPAEVGRQCRMVEHDRLEIRGEVNLDRFARGELRERVRRQRRRAMLHRAAQTILHARIV